MTWFGFRWRMPEIRVPPPPWSRHLAYRVGRSRLLTTQTGLPVPKKNPLPERKASFIESMECLPVPTVPEGAEWTYEIKLDGYRLEAVRSAGETTLFSRRKNVLNLKFGFIADALNRLPEGTVIDGELVALDTNGRPNFNLLQNFCSE